MKKMDDNPVVVDGSPLDIGQTELAKSAPGIGRLGIDIGISSIKLVWISRDATPGGITASLNFASFDSTHVDECVAFIKNFVEKQQLLQATQLVAVTVVATGKRAVEFQPRLYGIPGVKLHVEHEFDCQATGVEFLIAEVPRTVFTCSEDTFRTYDLPRTPPYPYLLVNIGSGVSFLKISNENTCEQVGGSSLGGGTLTGLLSVLTKSIGFDEMLDLAEQGDNSKVDKLIGDIYGTDYNGIGMKKTAVASSFGKVFSMQSSEEPMPSKRIEPETSHGLSISDAYGVPEPDVCRSLVFATFNNIGQLANLHSELHNVTKVYFAGPYIRGHTQTIKTLHIALNYYSRGGKRAYFLTHEDSIGAIGALLKA
ncbi:pantothenate kinase [Dactylonectria estremocensis]|uniref:Pantothenate kinase n=1 Tax=Dactylonectria estremocensis TaxID=1079267 RepID=A0A9P9J700_9HYPO|nr:pantothenate kinase [Dactylonectria estremocensis]